MGCQEVMPKIVYTKGYKYQLALSYTIKTELRPEINVYTHFLDLTREGVLDIRRGYAWDGPSGPTIDTKNFMRGSMVHDSIYQLIRNGHLPQHHYSKEVADTLLKKICIEDGMSRIRAWWVYKGVRLGGYSATTSGSIKRKYSAPSK